MDTGTIFVMLFFNNTQGPAMRRFEDLIVWQDARQLARLVYAATACGAFRSDWGLRDQIRRAAVSVMSNIAEGFERNSDPQFRHFLAIAKGSCGEVRAQLYVALDQSYIDANTFHEISSVSETLSRRLNRLATRIQAPSAREARTKETPRTG